MKNWKVLIVCVSLFLTNCQSLDVIPERVSSSEISFDGNEQNAGILDFTDKGWLITENAAKKYVSLSDKLGYSLTPPLERGEGLIIDPPNFYLSQEYMVKFATLNQKNKELWR